MTPPPQKKIHCELKKQMWHIETGEQSFQVPYLHNYCDRCYTRWHCPINIKGLHQEGDACFLVRKGLIIQTPQKGQFSSKWMQCKKVLHFRASDPIWHICSKINILGLWQVGENGYIRGFPTRVSEGWLMEMHHCLEQCGLHDEKKTRNSFFRKWKMEWRRKEEHKLMDIKYFLN